MTKEITHLPPSVSLVREDRAFDRTVVEVFLLYFKPVGRERTDPDLSDFIV